MCCFCVCKRWSWIMWCCFWILKMQEWYRSSCFLFLVAIFSEWKSSLTILQKVTSQALEILVHHVMLKNPWKQHTFFQTRHCQRYFPSWFRKWSFQVQLRIVPLSLDLWMQDFTCNNSSSSAWELPSRFHSVPIHPLWSEFIATNNKWRGMKQM